VESTGRSLLVRSGSVVVITWEQPESHSDAAAAASASRNALGEVPRMFAIIPEFDLR
jgi:hypothetical protein